MIYYRPTDGDPYPASLVLRARTCFLVTQIGQPLPDSLPEIHDVIRATCTKKRFQVRDATTLVTGKDFLRSGGSGRCTEWGRDVGYPPGGFPSDIGGVFGGYPKPVSGYGVGYGVEAARRMVGCGMTATVADCGDLESMPHFLRSPSEGFRAR